MSMACKVCNHPKRLAIDRAIVQGRAHQKIGKEFNVSWQSVRNHAMNHVSRQLTQAWAKKGAIEAMGLLNDIEDIIHKARLIFERNFKKNTTTGDGLALKAIDSERGTFELLVKIAQLWHETRLAELEAQSAREERARVEALDLEDFTIEEKRIIARAWMRKKGADGHLVEHRPLTPPPKSLPRPPVKTDFEADSKPEYSDEQETLDNTPDETETDPEEPMALPPAPVRPISGERGGLRLHRHLLGKKATTRPAKKRGADPLPFPNK